MASAAVCLSSPTTEPVFFAWMYVIRTSIGGDSELFAGRWAFMVLLAVLGLCHCVVPLHAQTLACLSAGAHELKERTRVPLQTNLIAYSSHATEVKEWYYYPKPSADSKAGGTAAAQSENERAGPITKDELRVFYAQNKVSNLCV
jgi:hypothetical protein